jgi:hypothetical protein
MRCCHLFEADPLSLWGCLAASLIREHRAAPRTRPVELDLLTLVLTCLSIALRRRRHARRVPTAATVALCVVEPPPVTRRVSTPPSCCWSQRPRQQRRPQLVARMSFLTKPIASWYTNKLTTRLAKLGLRVHDAYADTGVFDKAMSRMPADYQVRRCAPDAGEAAGGATA